MNKRLTGNSIAIIGGGPAGLFVYKRLVQSPMHKHCTITVFEAGNNLGMGMPYSTAGANMEHVTNVSGNEIPELLMPVTDWLKALPAEVLEQYGINPGKISEYKVFPRLLFGNYLREQFEMLQQVGKEAGITTTVYLQTGVNDIIDAKEKIIVEAKANSYEFDTVIICTGHTWPLVNEGKVPGYFDSPYPPSKLQYNFNHEIAIRGSSLTAIDAIRTLARQHGQFLQTDPHKITYVPNGSAENFKIVMHTRHGLLPAIRFHLEDSHLAKDKLLSSEDIQAHMNNNDGFLSLDFIFEKDFKDALKEKDLTFYEEVKDLSIEAFVHMMMNMRERLEAFDFFKEEYTEAENSIRRRESVYWKELLAVLSFALNYPAKHLSAEDMLRLQEVLMPLISIVIAFVPQSSAAEMIALHKAGLLKLVAVGNDSKIQAEDAGGIHFAYSDENGEAINKKFETFVDCIGQRHLSVGDFPFKSLVNNGSVSAARLKFRSAQEAARLIENGNEHIDIEDNDRFYLQVPGLTITDNFKAVTKMNEVNHRIYIMAVPFIGGYNPDYSGLDFCEAASQLIINEMAKDITKEHVNMYR